MAAKRKRATKKKATRRRKGVSGTSRCKVVTINGKRRKLCWSRGRITSNKAVKKGR